MSGGAITALLGKGLSEAFLDRSRVCVMPPRQQGVRVDLSHGWVRDNQRARRVKCDRSQIAHGSTIFMDISHVDVSSRVRKENSLPKLANH